MVSNVLGQEPQELVQRLLDLRASRQQDPEYRALRAELPEDWPV